MPRILTCCVPLLFSSADKVAAKVVAAADPKALDGHTGIFVVGGKEKPLPKLAKDKKIQEAIIAQLKEKTSDNTPEDEPTN